MAFENHYEVDIVDKLDYIMAFYNGGEVDGASMPTQRGVVNRSLMSEADAITEALPFVYTSTNRVKKLGWGNEGIAEYINPRVFTNSDALMNTRGFLYGWVSADYVTAAVAKAVWLNNYPEGGLDYATVSFDPPQGSSLPSRRYSVQAGTTIRVPADIFPSATPQGRTFVGWDCNWKAVPVTTANLDERYIGNVMQHLSNESKGFSLVIDPTNRQVVMASPHTVTFRYGVGSQEERQVVQPFQKATRPETPTRTGYVFDDWYPTKDQPGSATPYDFNTPVTKETVLEAHWNRRRLTVSFDSDGGSEVRSEEVEYGNKVTRPADPTREGYDFTGWSYKMQNYAPWDLGRRDIAYDFDKPVLMNVDLKANWAPKQCTVTFTDGTVVKGTQRVAYGQKATPLNPEPTRLNYVFDGWHLPARVQGCQGQRGQRSAYWRKRDTDHDQYDWLEQDGYARYGRCHGLLVLGYSRHGCVGCCRSAGIKEDQGLAAVTSCLSW